LEFFWNFCIFWNFWNFGIFGIFWNFWNFSEFWLGILGVYEEFFEWTTPRNNYPEFIKKLEKVKVHLVGAAVLEFPCDWSPPPPGSSIGNCVVKRQIRQTISRNSLIGPNCIRGGA